MGTLCPIIKVLQIMIEIMIMGLVNSMVVS